MKTKKILSLILSCIFVFSITQYAFASNNSMVYKTNEYGETYGNDIQAKILGYDAELIFAMGEGGTLGYVRSSDLDDNCISPEEAIIKQNKLAKSISSVRYIPLYKEDGKTVVGEFAVYFDLSEIPSSRAVERYYYGTIGAISVDDYYTCETRSGIGDASGGVRGITTIRASEQVARGWLGAQARVYKDDGTLVRSTEYYYSDTAGVYFEQTGFYPTVNISESYYSKGIVKNWYPPISGYWTTGTFGSPCINPTLINS